MKMAHLKRVVLCFLLILVQIQFSYSQIANSPLSVHAILNLSHSLQNESQDFDSFNKAIEHKLWGVLLVIEHKNNQLILPLSSEKTIPFITVLNQLKSLSKSVRFESPIFIRYNGASKEIQQEIEAAHMEELLFIEDSIVAEENSFLLVFRPTDENNFENIKLEEIKFVERGRPIESDSVVSVNANKQGLFVSSLFEDEENIRYGNEAQILRIYVNTWNNHGMPPVFLEVNSYKKSMDAIINALANFPRISGSVNLTETNVGGIGWKEHSNMKTVGTYCFPVINTSNKTLTPVKPGFRFVPEKIQFKEGRQVMHQDFKQIPLKIHEKLMGYYRFNNDIKDAIGKNNAKRVIGAEFIEGDSIDDGHLQLFRGDFVELPATKNFKLKNSSLTVSVWVKVEDYHSDYLAIMCNSERVFRKGLQLAIRNEKPYFGFWNMDLAGKTVLKSGVWNHIVGTYNFANKEMSLYVNGKLDTRMGDIYSFIGEGQMFVARASDGHEFNGSVDELMIWNRALGDKEVEYLFENKNVRVPAASKSYTNIYIGGLIFAFLVLVIMLFLRRRKRKNISVLSEGMNERAKNASVKVKIIESSSKSKVIANQINIFLFGVFRFYNKNGENISHQFTPKVRDIFILILIYSIREEKGIQSRKLSELLWPDLTEMNAMNNKRVNINRLKNVIQEIDGINLVVEKKFYKIEFTEPGFCDYLQLMKFEETGEFNNKAFEIMLRGKFLETVNQLWADKLKSSFLDTYFDQVIHIMEDNSLSDELRYKATEVILLNDPVNEIAITAKLQLLKSQGKMNLAKNEYETFCKEYKSYYNEPFGKSLKEFVNS